MRTKISVIISAGSKGRNIEKTIQSLREQTLEDFEAIIVNSGSDDRSKDIICQYCDQDKRFIFIDKDDMDTGAAFNAGIEAAGGEYLIFFEEGDRVYPDALMTMYKTMRNEMADAAIGRTEIAYGQDVCVSQAADRLSRKSEIDRYDRDLNWLISPCSLIFRRNTIIRHELGFGGPEDADSALFVLRFAETADRIAGCDILVCRHTMRSCMPDGTGVMEDLKDMAERFDRITEHMDARMAEDEKKISDRPGYDPMELKEAQLKHAIYRSDLFRRYADILLNRYYRHTWLFGEDIAEYIEKAIYGYRARMLPSDWQSLCDDNSDLRLEKDGLMSKEELAEDPLLSVVITNSISDKELEKVLQGYYGQIMPAFEILADERLREAADEKYDSFPNLRYVRSEKNIRKFKGKCLSAASGKYIMFIDKGMTPSERIIKNMYETMESGNYAFVTSGIADIRAHRTVFINELTVVKGWSPYNKLDWMWGNKMFRIKTLNAKKVLFTDDPAKDIYRLYDNSGYSKISNLGFTPSFKQADLMKNVRSIPVRLLYPCKLRSEERRLKKLEKWNTPVVTHREKIKKLKNRYKKRIYKFLSLKIIFPAQYKKYSRAPVENKVIFVEPRLDYISNSLQPLHEAFEKHEGIEVKDHFLAHEFGRYRLQYKRTMEFMKDLATAKYAFMAEANDTMGGFRKRNETKVVQVWHGCGAFKKFGFGTADLLFGGTMKEQKKYPMYANYDLVTVSSPEVVWAYEQSMGIDHDSGIVRPLGISRTDMFYDDEIRKDSERKFEELVPERNGRKIILYAPTFRGRVSRAYAPDTLDIEAFAEKFGEDYILVTKHHPVVRELPEIPVACRDFAFDFTRSGMDINELLMISDICISDYSSLVFEYSLTERPVIFFAYDLEDYNDWRGFYYDYDQLTPGPVYTTNEEMIDYIANIDERFDIQKVRDFRNKFMSSCDGHATERVMDFVSGNDGEYDE